MKLTTTIRGPSRDRYRIDGPQGFVMVRNYDRKLRPACWKLTHVRWDANNVPILPEGGVSA